MRANSVQLQIYSQWN